VPEATVDGLTIHYEVNGDGFPLVLLHGIGSNSRSWRRQLATLSADFKVIAWDAPGYGRSSDAPAGLEPTMGFYADRLLGLLESLGLARIFLLGHSTGGVVAQEFYRRNPEKIRAMVLSDTRYQSSPEGLQQRLEAIHKMTPSQLALARAPKLLSANASPDLVDEVVSIMSEVRPAGFEFAAIALDKSNTHDVVKNLRVPTLLIWGSEDEITPVWREPLANTTLKIIRGAGHLCYIEQPDTFNEMVREFLRNQ
jgi:pimeloyl-ACP methyl ester carboxylesterase